MGRDPIPLLLMGQCASDAVQEDSSWDLMVGNIINYNLGPQELLLKAAFFSISFSILFLLSMPWSCSGSQSHLSSVIWEVTEFSNDLHLWFSKFEKIPVILLITGFSLVFQRAFSSKKERDGIEAKPQGPGGRNFLAQRVAWGGLRSPGRAGSCHMRQCSAFGKADMKWGEEEARDSETWSFTKQQHNDLLRACYYLKSFICIISFNAQTIRSIFTITLVKFFPRELGEPTASHRAAGWELNLASLTPDSWSQNTTSLWLLRLISRVSSWLIPLFQTHPFC